jgi:hypothetical protein
MHGGRDVRSYLPHTAHCTLHRDAGWTGTGQGRVVEGRIVQVDQWNHRETTAFVVGGLWTSSTSVLYPRQYLGAEEQFENKYGSGLPLTSESGRDYKTNQHNVISFCQVCWFHETCFPNLTKVHFCRPCTFSALTTRL